VENSFFRNVYYYKRYYLDFFEKQTKDVQKKFNWTLQLIATLERVPSKFFQHIEGTVGIFEIRVEVGSNIFRAFAFFDEGQLIVLGNAFQKKTPKTPKSELELAKKIKKEYFDEKSKNNKK
jgi:phage-related protein